LFYTYVCNERLNPVSPKNVDRETRQRLLQAAIMLFADRGFKNTSVREICELAGANVSSVNYHFRDKLGLYKEVIGMVADAMDRAKQEALDAAAGETPEKRLRDYIRHMVRRVMGEEKNWLVDLIGREMAQPSPAFGLIVEKGILPSGQRLAQLVSEVSGLPAGDPRTQFCAGMVHAQCFFFSGGKPVLKHLDPKLEFTSEYIDEIARQIAEFSLAGIRALASKNAPSG
jgi:TetR/AcrR family transcriptional regulator, regulator of cefoperazone and chloramphenicol sensitivity